MESLKRAIGSGGDEGGGSTTWFGELTGATQNESCCPSMSYKQVRNMMMHSIRLLHELFGYLLLKIRKKLFIFYFH